LIFSQLSWRDDRKKKPKFYNITMSLESLPPNVWCEIIVLGQIGGWPALRCVSKTMFSVLRRCVKEGCVWERLWTVTFPAMPPRILQWQGRSFYSWAAQFVGVVQFLSQFSATVHFERLHPMPLRLRNGPVLRRKRKTPTCEVPRDVCVNGQGVWHEIICAGRDGQWAVAWTIDADLEGSWGVSPSHPVSTHWNEIYDVFTFSIQQSSRQIGNTDASVYGATMSLPRPLLPQKINGLAREHFFATCIDEMGRNAVELPFFVTVTTKCFSLESQKSCGCSWEEVASDDGASESLSCEEKVCNTHVFRCAIALNCSALTETFFLNGPQPFPCFVPISPPSVDR